MLLWLPASSQVKMFNNSRFHKIKEGRCSVLAGESNMQKDTRRAEQFPCSAFNHIIKWVEMKWATSRPLKDLLRQVTLDAYKLCSLFKVNTSRTSWRNGSLCDSKVNTGVTP